MRTYNYLSALALLLCLPLMMAAQTLQDDFEGNGNISTWYGDNCGMNPNRANPFPQGINTSATVMEYHDTGGQYANVGFNASSHLDLSTGHLFTLKVYVPASGLTGNQPNQISLKLQNGALNEPWTTQTEIVKPIVLNQWQTLTFDFANDAFVNLNSSSLPPLERLDFNRIILQLNGENNTDRVLAYIDDFYYASTTSPDPVYNALVWSDEFDGNGAIDITKWFQQTQLPAHGSWFNGELQHYTNRIDNSFVENGVLKIVAKKETFTNQGQTKQYTSARLNSKFAFTYGRVEVRAKLPSGIGTWPAIWTLGKNITESGAYWQLQGFGTTSWPQCGEIDIMEHWGNNQNFVQSATHTPSSFGATVNHGGQVVPTASTDFHVYGLVWTPEKLVFSVDNVVHYTYNPSIKDASTWPFDADQYLLLNIAIQESIHPSFTQGAMEIDYVRVYQEGTVSTATPVDGSQTQVYYPNPVTNELNITVASADQQNIPLRITTIDGKLVRAYTAAINNQQINIRDLGNLPAGAYVVSYQLGNETHSLKIVKN